MFVTCATSREAAMGQPGLRRSPSGCPARQAARAAGDFLLVGLHSDEDVRERRGTHLPIMDLHERALSVLACCHVNEVIIGALAGPARSHCGIGQPGSTELQGACSARGLSRRLAGCRVSQVYDDLHACAVTENVIALCDPHR